VNPSEENEHPVHSSRSRPSSSTYYPEDSLKPPTEGGRPRPTPPPAGHLAHRGAGPRTSPPVARAHTSKLRMQARATATRKGSQKKNQSAVGDASEHLSASHPALGGLRLHPHGPRRLRGSEAPNLGKLGLLGSRHIARHGGRSPPPEAHMPGRPAYPAPRHPSTERRQQSAPRTRISTTSRVRHRPRTRRRQPDTGEEPQAQNRNGASWIGGLRAGPAT
jgi:hypothetical protein